jgi:hypothetical protein
MDGQAVIDFVKTAYRFKEGYKLVISYDKGVYSGFAFKQLNVKGKKDEGVAEICESTIGTESKEKFRMFVEKYCDKV